MATLEFDHTFRSDIRGLLYWCLKGAAVGIVLLLLLESWSQLQADCFPVYSELAFAALLPMAVAGAFAMLLLVAVLAYPVKLSVSGIRCYDLAGRFRNLAWSDMTSVQLVQVYGLSYVYIDTPGLSHPVTLPTWLDGMREFIALVEERAGQNHILARCLRDAT